METVVEQDRQYARAISIRERIDMLQDLQCNKHCKEMEARIKGYKEGELAQERMTIDLEYKNMKLNTSQN